MYRLVEDVVVKLHALLATTQSGEWTLGSGLSSDLSEPITVNALVSDWLKSQDIGTSQGSHICQILH